ncbi:putative holin-like toxin [Streptococcus sp. H49]
MFGFGSLIVAVLGLIVALINLYNKK